MVSLESAAGAKFCVCNLQGPRTDFHMGMVSLRGVSPCRAALLCKPCQESSQPRCPSGALWGWGGPTRVCASSSRFSFSGNVSITSWGNLPMSLAATICFPWLTFLVFIPPVDPFLQHTMLKLILLIMCVLPSACGCLWLLVFVTLQLGQIPCTSWPVGNGCCVIALCN